MHLIRGMALTAILCAPAFAAAPTAPDDVAHSLDAFQVTLGTAKSDATIKNNSAAKAALQHTLGGLDAIKCFITFLDSQASKALTGDARKAFLGAVKNAYASVIADLTENDKLEDWIDNNASVKSKLTALNKAVAGLS